MKKEDNSLKEMQELVKVIKPLADIIAPTLLKIKELDAPVIKRAQWMNFVIMIGLALLIGILTYTGKIDGSAATGLIGAIIGYVFGYIYAKREKVN